jgi:phosphinothricin acetyltransferase
LSVAVAEDGAGAADIYAPLVRDTAVSFEEEPPSPAEMSGRISRLLPTYPWIVCRRPGEILGYACADAHGSRAAYRWSAHSAVYVREDCRGWGVGRSLVEALLRILTLQGFCNVYAGITLPNPASVALHETAGYRPLCVYREVGFKAGQWHDVGWWHRMLGERPARPEAPRPFANLAASPAVEEALAAGARFLRVR